MVADGKNHVLEQSAKSDDAVFNLILVDDTNYADLELSVKLKAVGGKVDQGGGVGVQSLMGVGSIRSLSGVPLI